MDAIHSRRPVFAVVIAAAIGAMLAPVPASLAAGPLAVDPEVGTCSPVEQVQVTQSADSSMPPSDFLSGVGRLEPTPH